MSAQNWEIVICIEAQHQGVSLYPRSAFPKMPMNLGLKSFCTIGE